MQIGERQFLDHAARRFEFGLCLAGKSDHHVGADGRGRHGSANFLDLLAIVPGTIFAMHAPQNGIASGLHGHVACLAMRGDEAMSEISSSVQSMGSTEEMRSFSSAVSARMARIRRF